MITYIPLQPCTECGYRSPALTPEGLCGTCALYHELSQDNLPVICHDCGDTLLPESFDFHMHQNKKSPVLRALGLKN